MINSIDQCLFDGCVGEVPNTVCFGAVGVFDNRLLEIIALNVIECVTGYSGQWSLEFLFFKDVTARAIWELNNINLGGREECLRMLVEHHQANVFREG